MTIELYVSERKFANVQEIETAMQEDQIFRENIQGIKKYFHEISASEVMSKLSGIGGLLQIAYAGCKGYSSGPLAIGLLADFQTLAHDCGSACDDFTSASITALGKHQFAIRFAKHEKLDKAIKKIAETATLAAKMAGVCDDLLKSSTKLCSKAQEALIKTAEDQTCTADQKRKIKAMIRENTAREAFFKETKENLDEAIEEEKIREISLAKSEVIASRAEFILSFFPFSGARKIAAQRAQNIQAKEAEVIQKRREMQKELRENNALLAESVSKLAGMHSEEDDLEQSIVSLDVAIKTLGKVKTTFELIKSYWKDTERHCKSLADISSLMDESELAELDEDSSAFVNAIVESGYKWITMGVINSEASRALENVKRRVDAHMSNPPSFEETREVIRSLSATMLIELEEDNRVTIEVIEE